MLSRNVVLLLSLSVLLVEGDLDSNDAGIIQAMSTDKDSRSDEAPTESMNAVSPDQPDEPQIFGGGPSDTTSFSSETSDVAPAANQVTAPEPAAAAAVSAEEEDEDESADSDEGGKKRSAKPHSPALPPQSPALPPQSPAHGDASSTHVHQSPAHPPQPIIPQPKAAVRNRTSKRRSRTNRRQI